MTYNIINTSRTREFVVPDKTTVVDTPVIFVGKGLPDYGDEQNTNILHLLENFASETAPEKPVKGQIWAKMTNNSIELLYCTDDGRTNNGSIIQENVKWQTIPQIFLTQPTTRTNGTLWYNSDTHKLLVFDASEGINDWVQIGPQDASDVKFDIHDYKMIKNTMKTVTSTISNEYLNTDVEYQQETRLNSGSVGLFETKVIAKEIPNNGYGRDVTSTSNTRTCVWIFRYVAQGIKMQSGVRRFEMVGAPSYELLAKSDGFDITTDVSISNRGEINLTTKYNGTLIDTDNGSHIVVTYDTELVRA